MHCLRMQHNQMSVMSYHRHGFTLPPILWH